MNYRLNFDNYTDDRYLMRTLSMIEGCESRDVDVQYCIVCSVCKRAEPRHCSESDGEVSSSLGCRNRRCGRRRGKKGSIERGGGQPGRGSTERGIEPV